MCVWSNDQVKAAVERNEDAWREVLGAKDENAKERCLEVYIEEKRKIKRCKYKSKKEVQEESRRKM